MIQVQIGVGLRYPECVTGQVPQAAGAPIASQHYVAPVAFKTRLVDPAFLVSEILISLAVPGEGGLLIVQEAYEPAVVLILLEPTPDSRPGGCWRSAPARSAYAGSLARTSMCSRDDTSATRIDRPVPYATGASRRAGPSGGGRSRTTSWGMA